MIPAIFRQEIATHMTRLKKEAEDFSDAMGKSLSECGEPDKQASGSARVISRAGLGAEQSPAAAFAEEADLVVPSETEVTECGGAEGSNTSKSFTVGLNVVRRFPYVPSCAAVFRTFPVSYSKKTESKPAPVRNPRGCKTSVAITLTQVKPAKFPPLSDFPRDEQEAVANTEARDPDETPRSGSIVIESKEIMRKLLREAAKH